MAFYDYDMLLLRAIAGSAAANTEGYTLRLDGRSLPDHSRCEILDRGRYWLRTTTWRGDYHGRRYQHFYYTPENRDDVLSKVMQSGIAWAQRRAREECSAAPR